MKTRVLVGLLVATSVALAGVATVGLITEDTWSVTEQCTPVSVADSSGSVGSLNLSAVATSKSLYANNDLLTLESSAGTWNGRVSSAAVKSGVVNLSAVGPLEFLNSTKTAPPACNVTEFVGALGSQGTGNGQFLYPGDMVFDTSGNLFVADRGNFRIQKFTPDGNGGFTYAAQVGSSGTGNGQFGGAVAAATNPGVPTVGWLAVDSSGNVYATDPYNARVQKFTNALVYSAQVGSSGTGNGQFTFSTGITIDASNNVWVADFCGLVNPSRIQKFDTSLAYQSQFTLGSIHPRGIEVAPNGDLYITNAEAGFQVRRFTTAGSDTGYATPTTVATPGTAAGYFGDNSTANGQNPQDIAIDSTGMVYVSDLYNNRVQKFDATLTFVGYFGSYGTDNGRFSALRGMTRDANDNIYVADHGNHRVQWFTSPNEHSVPLSEVFQSYIELCDPGLAEHTFVWDCATDPLVAYAGWTDLVWVKLKQLAAATYRQIDPGASGVITISDIGSRTLSMEGHTPVGVTPQNQFAARAIELVNQNTEVGDGLLMYTADTILTVAVAQTARLTVTTNNSPTFVNNPAPVDVAQVGANQYAVQDSLGVQVPASTWAAAGGSITAVVGESTGQIDLTLTGPSVAIAGFTGPFSFATGTSIRTPQLTVTGSGVTQTPQVVTLRTGADEAKITSDVGQRVNIPFLTTKEECYDRGIWATVESVGTVEIEFDIPVNSSIPFGQYQGSIVDWADSRYRITEARIGLNKVHCKGRWHVTVADVDAAWAALTVSQVDALWSGFETGDYMIAPLRTA